MKRIQNKQLYNQLNTLKDFTIKTGWFEDIKYSNGATVGKVMAFQNFGGVIQNSGGTNFKFAKKGGLCWAKNGDLKTIGKTKPHQIIIPARPFMNNCINNNKNKWKKDMFELTKGFIKSFISQKQIIGQIKLSILGDLKQSIIELNQPPLAESTKAYRLNKYANKKGGNSTTLNKPLVDTGFALQHISNREE